MVRLLLGLTLILAAESAASACSCVPAPRDAAQRQALAREAAAGALALIEVELLAPYQRSGRGELLRVRRTLAGRAPISFTVERTGAPSSASCDLEFDRGQRTLLLLYPRSGSTDWRGPVYRVSSLCSSLLLADPAFRAAVLRQWPRRRR